MAVSNTKAGVYFVDDLALTRAQRPPPLPPPASTSNHRGLHHTHAHRQLPDLSVELGGGTPRETVVSRGPGEVPSERGRSPTAVAGRADGGPRWQQAAVQARGSAGCEWAGSHGHTAVR